MMTRPSIIRADTLDLQDQDAPSAQDHSKHPVPDSIAHAHAPHQAETLRDVAHETAEEESLGPRTSWPDGAPAAGDDLHKYAEGLVAGNGGSMAQSQAQQQEQQQQQDELAIAQNGGVSSSDEGDMDGDADDLDDDLMDRISSSPSIEDEDIDFEFVYALHTFVATVEGQANATKGDTMVLLDDSNSYWWLVRVVKDSSIGYLPAEHIETPTERLARLNKHRNIDLSATMLGDQATKQKNAFRSIRRKKKTVTFTDPTYVDYSEIEYSSDEEDIEELFGQQAPDDQQKEQSQQKAQQATTTAQQTNDDIEVVDDSSKVEPLKIRSKKEPKTEISQEETIAEEPEDAAEEDDVVEGMPEGPRQSRNGTVRNTDSFFKDETLEMKKITLTPTLLRDDNAPRPSSDSANKELKPRQSLDKMDKELVSDKDKRKNSKERERQQQKEKKPSAIRSFFSRKDKKRTSEDDDGESFGKRSMDIVGESRESDEPTAEEQAALEKGVQRSPSKLQKHQPRTEPTVASRGPPPANAVQKSSNAEMASYLEGRNNDVSNVPPASMRIVDPETHEPQEVPSNTPQSAPQSAPQPQGEKSTISKLMSPRSVVSAPDASKPKKTVKAKTRMELDESDSDEVEQVLMEEQQESSPPAPQRPPPDPLAEERKNEKLMRPQLPGAFPDSFQTMSTMSSDKTITPLQTQQPPQNSMDRGLESPMEVSPVSPLNPSFPPPLMRDTSSQDAVSPELSPSPDLGEEPSRNEPAKDQPEQTWDDAKLRAFFDDGEHIRDLLAVVYDKNDVVPAGMDHPIVGGLFREQNAKLAEITTQLDNMLGDWLARKQRLRGTV